MFFSKFIAEDSEIDSVQLKIFLESFEIYNDQFFDLMEPKQKQKALKSIADDQRFIIRGLGKREITSEDQFKSILKNILGNRSTQSNGINHHSSRSHAIFRLSCSFNVTLGSLLQSKSFKFFSKSKVTETISEFSSEHYIKQTTSKVRWTSSRRRDRCNLQTTGPLGAKRNRSNSQCD